MMSVFLTVPIVKKAKKAIFCFKVKSQGYKVIDRDVIWKGVISRV